MKDLKESTLIIRSLLEHLPYSAQKPERWVQEGNTWYRAEGPLSGCVDEDFDQAQWTILAKVGPVYRVVRTGTSESTEEAKQKVDEVIQRILSGGRE